MKREKDRKTERGKGREGSDQGDYFQIGWNYLSNNYHQIGSYDLSVVSISYLATFVGRASSQHREFYGVEPCIDLCLKGMFVMPLQVLNYIKTNITFDKILHNFWPSHECKQHFKFEVTSETYS